MQYDRMPKKGLPSCTKDEKKEGQHIYGLAIKRDCLWLVRLAQGISAYPGAGLTWPRRWADWATNFLSLNFVRGERQVFPMRLR